MTDTAVETTEQSTAPTRIPHWIAGRRREGHGRTAPVFNPAIGVAVSEVGLASADEVSEAIATAKAAFPAWRDLS
ncbi:aldehyde dehydrogenase family protein, partial [Agrococcus lahaulensis]